MTNERHKQIEGPHREIDEKNRRNIIEAARADEVSRTSRGDTFSDIELGYPTRTAQDTAFIRAVDLRARADKFAKNHFDELKEIGEFENGLIDLVEKAKKISAQDEDES